MSGNAQEIRQQIRDLRDEDMPLTDHRPLKKSGHGAVGQTLMMEALRQEGLGPDAVGKTAKQTYYPDLGLITIDLTTINESDR